MIKATVINRMFLLPQFNFRLDIFSHALSDTDVQDILHVTSPKAYITQYEFSIEYHPRLQNGNCYKEPATIRLQNRIGVCAMRVLPAFLQLHRGVVTVLARGKTFAFEPSRLRARRTEREFRRVVCTIVSLCRCCSCFWNCYLRKLLLLPGAGGRKAPVG